MKRSFYLPETLKFKRKKEERNIKIYKLLWHLLFLRDAWMKEDGQKIGTRWFNFHCFLSLLKCWQGESVSKMENL